MNLPDFLQQFRDEDRCNCDTCLRGRWHEKMEDQLQDEQLKKMLDWYWDRVEWLECELTVRSQGQ